MVKRIFNLINKEIDGLHEAAYLLAFFAFLSQILALIRDRLFAHFFGAGQVLDVYYAAFRIPDFIFVTIASIVSISVLIPFLVEAMNKKDDGQDFISSVFSFFFAFIVIVSVIVFFFVPVLVRYLFPGFSDAIFMDLIVMTRILLLSPILLGLSNLFATVIQVNKKFIVYSLSPLLYNIGIITGILCFYPIWGLKGLAFGVVLGAIMHLSIQIPFVAMSGIIPKFTLKINWGDIKEIVYLSLPRTITLSANSIAFVFLVGFASVMGVGAISVFNLSFNLQSIPLSIIGVSYSVAAFPILTKLFSKGEKDEFLQHIIIATRHIIFWSVPVLILFIVLRAQIVRTILGSGAFSWSDTRLTAACLAMFAVSIVAQGLILLFVRGYYAMGNTKKPLLINVVSAVLIIVFAYGLNRIFVSYDVFRYFLESLFRIEDVAGAMVLILPLSYSMGVSFNAFLLWFIFQKDFKQFSSSVMKTLWQSLSAGVIMGFVSYNFLGVLGKFLDINTFWGIFLQGFFAGIIGIIVGIILLKVLKNEEIIEVWNTLHVKFWKVKTLIPEQREL